MSAPGTVLFVNLPLISIWVAQTIFIATRKRNVTRNVLFRNHISIWLIFIRIVVLRLGKERFRYRSFGRGVTYHHHLSNGMSRLMALIE